jgi:hypothetical protein
MNATANRVVRYFLDLGFYPGEVELGTGLQRKRLAWLITVYVLLFLGLSCRQWIDLKQEPVKFSVANLQLGVFVASAVVAIALFPPFTAWFNKRFRKPSWEQVMWAFSFGFLVNLSNVVDLTKFLSRS